jgi:replicative DNA helicase
MENKNEKKYKIIVKPSVARKLIHAGNQVVDIKSNKSNPEASVFVFLNDDKFKESLKIILQKKV